MQYPEQGRSLQQIYQSDADLVFDQESKTLTVKLYNLNTKKDDKVTMVLCD